MPVNNQRVILEWELPPLATSPPRDQLPSRESYFNVTEYSVSNGVEDVITPNNTYVFTASQPGNVLFRVIAIYSNSFIDILPRESLLNVTVPEGSVHVGDVLWTSFSVRVLVMSLQSIWAITYSFSLFPKRICAMSLMCCTEPPLLDSAITPVSVSNQLDGGDFGFRIEWSVPELPFNDDYLTGYRVFIDGPLSTSRRKRLITNIQLEQMNVFSSS